MLNADAFNSDVFSDFSLRATNGYIELRHNGVSALHLPHAALAGLTVAETLTVLVARYEADGRNCM